MPSYYLINEHIPNKELTNDKPTDPPDHVTMTPHWILYVVRFKQPLLSSRQLIARDVPPKDSHRPVSIDGNFMETKRPLLISDSCVQLDIGSSKENFISTLNATIKPPNFNKSGAPFDLMAGIMPGDWLLAWCMNSDEKYESVISRLFDGKAANGPDDGLKFVGRVRDVREMIVQSPEGPRTVHYIISGAGFSELESSIFFHPALSGGTQTDLGRALDAVGISIRDIYGVAVQEAKQGGIDPNKAIPTILKALVGEGLKGPSVATSAAQRAYGASVSTPNNDFGLPIPAAVLKILGGQEKISPTFADILGVQIGKQKYSGSTWPETYYPDNTSYGKQDTFFPTKNPVDGRLLPVPIEVNGNSIWNMLYQYSNPGINEMYTAVKLTPSGRVMPTLVLRQLPFSLPTVADAYGDQVTAYHELPRWVAAPVLVRGLDVGRSDGLRQNFVQTTITPTKEVSVTDPANQLFNNPPHVDSSDIKRNGLRLHVADIPASSVALTDQSAARWTKVRADFVMAGHMFLTGSASILGVTSPIAVGDNFEYGGNLYHIEELHHTCSVDPSGRKQFITRLGLTHGCRADPHVARTNQHDTASRTGSAATSPVEERDQFPGETASNAIKYMFKSINGSGSATGTDPFAPNRDLALFSLLDEENNELEESGAPFHYGESIIHKRDK